MADTKGLLDNQNVAKRIADGIWFLEGLQDIQKISTSSAIKMEHNAIIHCRKGRLLLEIGGGKQLKAHEGQLILIPTEKLLHPMMVSTDVEVSSLIVSDKMLRTILGPQIGIWNSAIYMQETFVIDGKRWTNILRDHSLAIFQGGDLKLGSEITMSFLRTLLLIVCEQLLRQESTSKVIDTSTDRDKEIFNQFLVLLGHEQHKRRQVSYYAERLYITPKYLSTVCTRVSGKSPMRWITDSVMEQCYTLLKTTNMSIKEISNQMGFPNPSFFGQYFRDEAGMTPLEYRTGRRK
jgi:AraC-like DNA-binding protein